MRQTAQAESASMPQRTGAGADVEVGLWWLVAHLAIWFTVSFSVTAVHALHTSGPHCSWLVTYVLGWAGRVVVKQSTLPLLFGTWAWRHTLRLGSGHAGWLKRVRVAWVCC